MGLKRHKKFSSIWNMLDFLVFFIFIFFNYVQCTNVKDLFKSLKNTNVLFVTLLFNRKTASKMVDFIYVYL